MKSSDNLDNYGFTSGEEIANKTIDKIIIAVKEKVPVIARSQKTIELNQGITMPRETIIEQAMIVGYLMAIHAIFGSIEEKDKTIQ